MAEKKRSSRAPLTVHVEGRDLLGEPRRIEDLAGEQGVKVAADFESLLGDFWPEDESADEFISAVRAWRTEGSG